MDMPLEERPATIHTEDEFLPRGPWSFWWEAIPGGFSLWGTLFILVWMGFQTLCSAAWAEHLRQHVGTSALSNFWGELLTARDVWELMENGGLKDDFFGFWGALFAMLCIAFILWAGWKLQAAALGMKARFSPWIWGFLDALLIGFMPFAVLASLLTGLLSWLGGTGIQGLGWANLVGTPLVRMACASGFLLQWWLCRQARANEVQGGWLMGSWIHLGRHFRDSFLRVWMHPIQWGTLVMGGVVVRVGLVFSALLLAWRMGGGTPGKVWIFWLLLMVAVIINAWLIGWFLRLTALFWRQDAKVRQVICELNDLSSARKEAVHEA